MKKCKIDEEFIAFESENEFYEALGICANEFDNTLKEFIKIFGSTNIYIRETFKEDGFIDEIYIDVKHISADCTDRVWFDADELYFERGFLRMWLD